MISALTSSASFGLAALEASASRFGEAKTAGIEPSEEAREKARALESVSRTLDRMTDPAARMARAQAALQQEMSRAQAELEALQYLKVIDPEAAARAAEEILSRLDSAVSAYTASVKSLSGSGEAASGRSPEQSANALKAAAQKVASQQAAPAPEVPDAPEAPVDLPSPEEVKAQLKDDLQTQISEAEQQHEGALDALREQGAEQASALGAKRGHDEFLDELRQLTERLAALAESGEEEGDESGDAADRIKGQLREAAIAVSAFHSARTKLDLPSVDIRA